MANTAHYIAASTERNPVIVIRDDRGAEVVELELPPSGIFKGSFFCQRQCIRLSDVALWFKS